MADRATAKRVPAGRRDGRAARRRVLRSSRDARAAPPRGGPGPRRRSRPARSRSRGCSAARRGAAHGRSALVDGALRELGRRRSRSYGYSFLFFKRQVVYAAVGVGGAARHGADAVPASGSRCRVPLVASHVVLLVLVAPSHRRARPRDGASRWIGLGPVTFQPSEFAKFAFVAFAAAILAAEGRQARRPAAAALPLGPVRAGSCAVARSCSSATSARRS